MSEFEDVAGLADLPQGEMLGVTLANGTPVCVFNHQGTIGAVGNLCTHADFYISDGVMHADGTLECIWHGARFNCHTGAVMRVPAQKPLPVYAVQVENDRILVAPSAPMVPE